jgi:EpsI family protein
MRSSLLRNHYWFGWGVFAVALVIFFYVTARLIPESAASREPTPAAAAAPHGDLAGMALAVAMLLALPALSALLRSLRPPASIPNALAADPQPPWSPALVNVDSSWQPRFNGADREQRLAFVNSGGETVEVYTVAYHSQRQGAELIGSGSSVIGATLRQRSDAIVQLPGRPFRENEVVERAAPHGEYLIWARYQIAGRDFVMPLTAQLWFGVNATVSDPSAALLAFRAACLPDCDAARRTLAAASGALNAR